MSNNDYYAIAYNDLRYLQLTLGTDFYNPIAVAAQQIVEKMLKSIAERVCIGNEKLMCSHNLRALYLEIHSVCPQFVLDKGALSMLKDFYFDAKYPGANYVDVDWESCAECIDVMYDVIEKVHVIRKQLGLPIEEVEVIPLAKPASVQSLDSF